MLLLLSADFDMMMIQKLSFFITKNFQEHIQSVKLFGSGLVLTFSCSLSGSKVSVNVSKSRCKRGKSESGPLMLFIRKYYKTYFQTFLLSLSHYYHFIYLI